MEIVVIGGKKPDKGYMVRMTPDEALSLISSLSLQIRDRGPNANRQEFYTKDRTYFSIAVHPCIP
jgi:hypothetical protein